MKKFSRTALVITATAIGAFLGSTAAQASEIPPAADSAVTVVASTPRAATHDAELTRPGSNNAVTGKPGTGGAKTPTENWDWGK